MLPLTLLEPKCRYRWRPQLSNKRLRMEYRYGRPRRKLRTKYAWWFTFCMWSQHAFILFYFSWVKSCNMVWNDSKFYLKKSHLNNRRMRVLPCFFAPRLSGHQLKTEGSMFIDCTTDDEWTPFSFKAYFMRLGTRAHCCIITSAFWCRNFYLCARVEGEFHWRSIYRSKMV